MIEKEFIKKGVDRVRLESFLNEELGRANYSHLDITKTPVSTRITIYAEKPGLVIGKGGHRIREVVQKLKDQFDIENPEVEAEEVKETDLDAEVVAKNIASWLEKGGHPKRVGNTYLNRVMDAGAVGAQIEISGKLSGSRGRTDKFMDGYVKKCGKTSEEYVDKAYTIARTKPGALGIKVLIMKDVPDYMHRSRKMEELETKLIESKESDVEEKTEKASDEGEAEMPAVKPEEMVEGNVKEIKGRMKAYKEELPEDGFKELAKVLLEAEKNNKDRKTLVSYLEGIIEG